MYLDKKLTFLGNSLFYNLNSFTILEEDRIIDCKITNEYSTVNRTKEGMFNEGIDFCMESIGLSQREFLTLFLLHSLSKKANYPRAIHGELKNSFTGKVHSYDYLCKIAKQLVASDHLSLFVEKGRNYYEIMDKGKELFTWYQDNFSNTF